MKEERKVQPEANSQATPSQGTLGPFYMIVSERAELYVIDSDVVLRKNEHEVLARLSPLRHRTWQNSVRKHVRSAAQRGRRKVAAYHLVPRTHLRPSGKPGGFVFSGYPAAQIWPSKTDKGIGAPVPNGPGMLGSSVYADSTKISSRAGWFGSCFFLALRKM